MRGVIRRTARLICALAASMWMSALLTLAAAPASAQSPGGEKRPIDIAVVDLGRSGTFQVLINDRGLVVGLESSTGLNFVLDTRTGAYEGSLPGFDLFDINKAGEVVGIYDAPRSAGGTQGAFWTQEGGRRLSSTFLARGINTHGDIAGNCIVAIDQVGPPCVLIRGRHDDLGAGVIQVLNVGTDFAYLVDINDHGVAVGNASYADGPVRAFTWSLTDGVRFLDAPPSTTSFAAAINNHGQVAGMIQSDNVGHPTMWFAGSGGIDAELTAVNGYASAINDHGALLVTAQTAQLVWIPSRDIVATLPPADPTASGVFAVDINNGGEIIGAQYHAGPDGVVLSTQLIMWEIAIRGAHQ